jgi:hypothetical protein
MNRTRRQVPTLVSWSLHPRPYPCRSWGSERHVPCSKLIRLATDLNRGRPSPKSHARIATPETTTTRGSRPQKLEGPCRRISEPSSFGHLRSECDGKVGGKAAGFFANRKAGKRRPGAPRWRRKQTIPKSANIMYACGMRGSRWRKDASLSTFLM